MDNEYPQKIDSKTHVVSNTDSMDHVVRPIHGDQGKKNNSKKMRLDSLLVELGHFESRTLAQRTILSGQVWVDGVRSDKVGTMTSLLAHISVKQSECIYVSRGGLKLHKALETFSINVQGVLALDVGASTGGFTHCLLEHGAKNVIALDVGFGQLAWSLRQDTRVHVFERTNFRILTADKLPYAPDFVVADVSFISLRHLIPVLSSLVMDRTEAVLLVKPQFEAGPKSVPRNGVVKDKKVHYQVLKDLIYWLCTLTWEVLNISFSPIKGPKGNIEFLLHLRYRTSEQGDADARYREGTWDQKIEDMVESAHTQLVAGVKV